MQKRHLAVPVFLGFAGLAISACSSSDPAPITMLGTTSSSGSSSTSAGSTSTSSGGSQATGSGGSSGSSTTSAGNSSGGSTGSAGSAGTTGSAGSAGSGTAGGGSTLSDGCNKPLPALVTPGQWSDLADQAQQAGKPAPIDVPCDGVNATPASTATPWDAPPCTSMVEKRGYWVYVNKNYDSSKPSKVIYEGAGCDDPSPADGGTSGYPYQQANADNSDPQVIQVGLDYSRKDECYDNANPTSNDFKYFPIVQKAIEDNFCVDKKEEMYSGYSSGSWLGNQFSCAFPDTFRAMVLSTGNEPPQQPMCAAPTHPIATMMLHDLNDTINTYSGMLPACSRVLKLNGCTTTTCDPTNMSTFTAYNYPTNIGVPQGTQCVSFNGCPMDAPVVWCTTQLGGVALHDHYADGQSPWITPLFWSFLSKY
ncbi:MAG TPA: hypothetical protein VGM44_18950 [Polyangiaceae bacterium]